MQRRHPLNFLFPGAPALAAAVLLGGCVFLGASHPPSYGSPLQQRQLVRILDVDEPSPAFYRERARLEAMGPELDPVLVGVVGDAGAPESARANALLLLADRRAPGTVPLLRRELTASPSDAVRAAAVAGLYRFAADSAGARDALRAAIDDPAARVRLNVLQRLDVEDAPLVRAQLDREGDPQVRTIARQILELLEARGAPLARDARGDLRATVPDGAPQIVFHPTGTGRASEVETGALWVELPSAGLVPLAQGVEVVERIVPAYFDPARSVVVYEAGGSVWLRDLGSGETIRVGGGFAPRAIPFTGYFVFARELPEERREGVDGGSVEVYDLYRGAFAGGEPVAVGRLRAELHPARLGGASPVRTMAVGEALDGFVLRAPGMTPVPLPGPVLYPEPAP